VLRSLIRRACVVAFFFASTIAIAQTEFSADLVNHKQSSSTVDLKLYFGKDKIRFDRVDSGAESEGAGIVNFATQTMTVLMKQQQMYIEMPVAQSPGQKDIYHFFRAGDVENACADWQKIASNQSGSCHKVGHETVNGRETVKYEGANSKGESGYFWIDPKLRFPLKWQDNKGGGGELRNIQEGPQPPSLFEVPAGYTKFDKGSMRQKPH